MTQSVLFDLDGTLIDIAAGRSRFATEIFGCELNDFSDLSGTPAEFCARLACRVGECPRRVHAAYRSRIGGLATPMEGLDTVLESLMGRVRLGIVSNGSGCVQRMKIKNVLGRWASVFEVVLISGEFGRGKPHPAIFTAALQHLGVAAADVMFIGDDPATDIVGAAAVGMRTCLISPAAPSRGDVAADNHVRRLAEIPGVMPW